MTRLGREFFSRPSVEVAPDLLGKVLRRGDLAARIVETEAYAQDEPACHAYRGRTPSNEVLFGPPGHLYVYFTYGMHHCANTVTGTDGVGEGVLLRAAAPLEGVETMIARRAKRDGSPFDGKPHDLLRGPARLAKAFALDRTNSGIPLITPDSDVTIHDDGWEVTAVKAGPRVGVRLAADLPWRFWLDGNPHVSRYTKHPNRSGAASRAQLG